MSSNPSSSTPQTAAVFVDAHVHIHKEFRLDAFLDAAAKNFSAQASKSPETARDYFVLCLTETQNANQFAKLRTLVNKSADPLNAQLTSWKAASTDEPESLQLSHPEFGSIFVIAGRQIVTAERLEVLALGCDSQWKDGNPSSDVISRLNAGSSVPVIPWGFGKWFGGRGQVVMSLMRAHRDQILFLGDNSGRPSILPQPAHFQAARKMGIKILPGTDPLPFASEQTRAGLFGFILPNLLDENKPWHSIRRQIVNPNIDILPYGTLESPWRFVRNQIAMQWLIRRASTSRRF